MGTKLAIFLLILAILSVYSSWLTPGLKVATDFSYNSKDLLDSLFDFPKIWLEKYAEGMGEYTVFTLWSYPLSLLAGFLSRIGLGFWEIEIILLLIPIILISIISVWKIGDKLNLSNFAKFIFGLFYSVNTYIILVIDGGQLPIGLAYAFFPLSFLLVEGSVNAPFTKKILAGLAVWVLGSFDIRFIYVLVILTFIRFVYEAFFLTPKQLVIWIVNWLKSSVVIGTVFVGLNFYWILPLIKAPLTAEVISSLTKTDFVNFQSLGHTFLMLTPHWYINVFGKITPLRFEFLLLPILVFLAPILKPINKMVGFWLVVALISVFLAKGANAPVEGVYPWLYAHIPGFSLLRDPTKFYFLIALSYGVLIGITIDEIVKRLNKLPKAKFIFILAITGYLIFIIRPLFQGKMTGTFSKQPLEKEFATLRDYLIDDKAFARVLWIPATHPLTYSDHNHPIVEASRLTQKRPFAIGVKGTYETFNFLREAPFTGELLDVSGVGYIAYPYLDNRRDNLHPENIKYYYTFLDQILGRDFVDGQVIKSDIPLIKVKNHQPKLFLTDNSWLIIGSDNIYSESTKSAKLRLARNGLIFAEENPGMGEMIDKLSFAKVVLNNKTQVDLAATFITPDRLIFPAKKLSLHPNSSGWWKRDGKDVISWRDFLQTKYGIDNLDFDLVGGWAVGEGSLKLKMRDEKLNNNSTLLARVLESSRSGQLQFYQSNQLVGSINTKVESSNVRWHEVGLLYDHNPLTIESSGDINVVNALAVVDQKMWQQYLKKADSLGERISTYEDKNVSNNNSAILEFRQIDATKYEVKITNLKKPQMLVLSQAFDPRWELNGQGSTKVYSLLNGFKIEKDGQYLLEFEPQRYILGGLIISGITLAICLMLLISHKKVIF